MTKFSINLIRHGEKKLFLPNPGLTELGKKQATSLANALVPKQKQSFNKKIFILSSPQRRTQETANILAKQLQLPVIIDEFLNINQPIRNDNKGKNHIIKHFSNYFKAIDLQTKQGEIFAITHSQNIKNFWQVLAGPIKAIQDVYECGMWTIIIEEEKIEFLWTKAKY